MFTALYACLQGHRLTQMLHRGRQVAVGPSDSCALKLELNQVQCPDEAHLRRRTFDCKSRLGEISANRKPRSKTVGDSFGITAISCFACNISLVLYGLANSGSARPGSSNTLPMNLWRWSANATISHTTRWAGSRRWQIPVASERCTACSLHSTSNCSFSRRQSGDARWFARKCRVSSNTATTTNSRSNCVQSLNKNAVQS